METRNMKSSKFFRKWSQKYRPSTDFLEIISTVKELRKNLDEEMGYWNEIFEFLRKLQSERRIELSKPNTHIENRVYGYKDEDGEIDRLTRVLDNKEKVLSGDTKFLYQKTIAFELIDNQIQYDLWQVQTSYELAQWKRNLIKEIDIKIDDLETTYKFSLRSEDSDLKIIFWHYSSVAMAVSKWFLKLLASIWREIKSLDRWVLMLLILAILSAFGFLQFQESIEKLIEKL